MRVPVPGPRDVLALLERGADSVEQLLAAVPRVVSLLGEAERLVERADALVDQIERTSRSASSVADRAGELVDGAERLVARTEPLVERLTSVLDATEPSLTRLQPTLERLSETTDPREVDAIVALVDLLPSLAQKMETDVLPVLDSLGTVAPDLRDLLDIARELNEVVGEVPGLGRIKRRVESEQDGGAD
ncbi:MAG: hypothetical protein ACRDO8_04965 [Nocardioidaceae bacterium]